MHSKILLAAFAVATVAIPATAQAQRAPATVSVVVDTDRVFQQCNACKTATTQLQSQVRALEAQQKTLGDQLRPERQSLENAVRALNGKEPDAALTQRIQAFQQRERQAAQQLQQTQQRIQSIQAHVLRQIDQRLGPIINQAMTARGANLALSVDATLAHAQSIDITTDVLARLNTALPSVSLTPLPQQQQQQQRQQPQGR